MPALSAAFNKNNKVELQHLAVRSSSISMLTGLPVLLLAIFYGEDLILKFFGSQYHGAEKVLLILSLGQMVNASAGSIGLLMFVSRKEHIVMITQGVVLVLNIALCFMLIPSKGAIGAAIASAISLSLRNVYLVIYSYTKFGIIPFPIFKP
jgi:O-antigen/teichoic acid export membrane protein